MEFRYSADRTQHPPPHTRMTWKSVGQADYPDRIHFSGRLYGTVWTRETKPYVVWVGDKIDGFRFYPDLAPYRIILTRVELLIPAEGAP